MQHPQSEFDRYLNARGYTNSDYLYDILGTQCLRNMRYADAVMYFGQVGEKYPYTQKGKLVRGECDNLYDYNPISRRRSYFSWY